MTTREDQAADYAKPFEEILTALKDANVATEVYTTVYGICESYQREYVEYLDKVSDIKSARKGDYAMDHNTMRSAVTEMQAIEGARLECAAYLDGAPLAFDSAGAVYAHALRNMGMPAREVAAISPHTHGGIFRAMQKANAGRRNLAMDAGHGGAAAKFKARFPSAVIPKLAAGA